MQLTMYIPTIMIILRQSKLLHIILVRNSNNIALSIVQLLTNTKIEAFSSETEMKVYIKKQVGTHDINAILFLVLLDNIFRLILTGMKYALETNELPIRSNIFIQTQIVASITNSGEKK